MSLETTRDDTRGVSNPRKKAVEQVRPRFSGGQDHSLKEPPDQSNQFVAQRTSCHQQDDTSSPSLLVVKDG